MEETSHNPEQRNRTDEIAEQLALSYQQLTYWRLHGEPELSVLSRTDKREWAYAVHQGLLQDCEWYRQELSPRIGNGLSSIETAAWRFATTVLDEQSTKLTMSAEICGLKLLDAYAWEGVQLEQPDKAGLYEVNRQELPESE